jgi:hypothetical protein
MIDWKVENDLGFIAAFKRKLWHHSGMVARSDS